MECLGCAAVECRSVTLANGTVVCDTCPAWTLETEARTVLAKPLEDRRAYLDAIEKLRGGEKCEELKTVIAVLWSKKDGR
jgi:hypothetical protein